jgi:hypothetical protein
MYRLEGLKQQTGRPFGRPDPGLRAKTSMKGEAECWERKPRRL